MIRDPSDGSTREPKKSAPVIPASQNIAERPPSSDAAVTGADTGLPPANEGNARLQRSREWLKGYHERKSAVSPALDQAIQDELDHPPKSIMGDEQ